MIVKELIYNKTDKEIYTSFFEYSYWTPLGRADYINLREFKLREDMELHLEFYFYVRQ